MIVYVDSDFKCHLVNDGTMIEFESSFFDNKSSAFIEGFRAVPEGRTWTRDDGRVFGEGMISPWKDSRLLGAYQYQYDLLQEELNKAYQEGVNSI